jgi:ParB-like nuclease domain
MTSNLGDKPELRWIKLTELYIPSEYQRSAKNDSSLKSINYIKSNFNWASCGALLVCELEQSKPRQYAIIDGQHRFRAAEAHGGMSELPCVVITPRDAKKQAGHFIEVNSRRIKLSNLHQYRASVVAGEPTASSVAAILEKAKISVPVSPMGNKDCPPRTTQAIGTLLKMIDCFSEKQIIWALTIIPEAYGDSPGVIRASLLKAMAEWIKRYPDTDRQAMVATLQNIDLDELEKDARAYRAIDGKRTPEAFMMVIERKYKGTRRNVTPGEAGARSSGRA